MSIVSGLSSFTARHFDRPWLQMYNVLIRPPRSLRVEPDESGSVKMLCNALTAQLASLPYEILFEVLNRLSSTDIFRLISTCRHLRYIRKIPPL